MRNRIVFPRRGLNDHQKERILHALSESDIDIIVPNQYSRARIFPIFNLRSPDKLWKINGMIITPAYDFPAYELISEKGDITFRWDGDSYTSQIGNSKLYAPKPENMINLQVSANTPNSTRRYHFEINLPLTRVKNFSFNRKPSN